MVQVICTFAARTSEEISQVWPARQPCVCVRMRMRTRVSERAQDQARNALITLGRGNPKYAQVAAL